MTGRFLTTSGLAVWAAVSILSTSASHSQAAASGGEPSRTQSYEECRAASGGVTVELRSCYVAELQRRRAALDRLYREVLRTVAPERRDLLRKAERAWTAFVEAECNFSSSVETGGSDYPLFVDGCYLELTARRIEELQQALKTAQFVDSFGKPHGPNARHPP